MSTGLTIILLRVLECWDADGGAAWLVSLSGCSPAPCCRKHNFVLYIFFGEIRKNVLVEAPRCNFLLQQAVELRQPLWRFLELSVSSLLYVTF